VVHLQGVLEEVEEEVVLLGLPVGEEALLREGTIHPLACPIRGIHLAVLLQEALPRPFRLQGLSLHLDTTLAHPLVVRYLGEVEC